VPSVLSYQFFTMSTPSGLSEGTSRTIVLSSISRTSGSSDEARRCAMSMPERYEPTSVEWTPQVISTTVFPLLI
jgi:hypothetical protein